MEIRRQLGARRRQLGTRDETRCSTRGGGGWSRGALRVQGYGGLGKSFFVWRRPAGGSRTTGGVHSSSSSTLAACSSSAKSSPAAANTPMLCLPPVGGKEREGVNYTVNHKPYRSDGKKTMRSASAKRARRPRDARDGPSERRYRVSTTRRLHPDSLRGRDEVGRRTRAAHLDALGVQLNATELRGNATNSPHALGLHGHSGRHGHGTHRAQRYGERVPRVM